jgi:hypothetical protein
MHNACARQFRPEPGPVLTVLRQMATGLKELARSPSARTHFDSANQNALVRRSHSELGTVVNVLGQMAAGLKADVD